MFYSQVILAKKGPLAKVWLAAHWGDKKLARPQIFATDISQSCTDIMNPSVPLALRLSGHLLLGVVRIYSRKVKYVLNDCTEAMLKLQMAFTKGANSTSASGTANAAAADRELLTDQDAPTNNLVSNFGEYDTVHVVEGFCLPLPEDNEWILAEDDEEEGITGASHNSQAMLLTAHMPPASSQGRSPGTGAGFPSPEEETWAPFDPDNEDDNEDEGQIPPGSRVSDIEIVRAANDSLMSDDQTRRASSILDDSKDLPGGAAAGSSQNPNEEEDDFNVPFADDSEDEQGPAGGARSHGRPSGLDDSMLQLSHDGGSAANLNNQSNLSGLDDSPSSKRSREQIEPERPRRKRRKRRKVVIDNEKTELSNEHIRDMLSDTSDIVRRMVHPASVWDDEEENPFLAALSKGEKPKPPSLTQPFLADEEQYGGPSLHPRLRKLWTDNYWKALGQPCPFRMQTATGERDGDSVEQVRRDQEEDEQSELEVPTADGDDDIKKGPGDTEHPDDEFDMPQMDEDEEEEPADGPALDIDDEELEHVPGMDDELDLGLVNDLAIDSEDEEDRQALGDVASSATKWHKHTIRVFQHLKKCMRDPNYQPGEDEHDEDQQELPSQADFHQITKNVISRRNAASVFFEVLQLKTWDFIEVDQVDPYGEITISPGVRFGEAPPN